MSQPCSFQRPGVGHSGDLTKLSSLLAVTLVSIFVSLLWKLLEATGKSMVNYTEPNLHPSKQAAGWWQMPAPGWASCPEFELNHPCVLWHTQTVPGPMRAAWKTSTHQGALYNAMGWEGRPGSPACWETQWGALLGMTQSVVLDCSSGEDLSCQSMHGGDILVIPWEK